MEGRADDDSMPVSKWGACRPVTRRGTRPSRGNNNGAGGRSYRVTGPPLGRCGSSFDTVSTVAYVWNREVARAKECEPERGRPFEKKTFDRWNTFRRALILFSAAPQTHVDLLQHTSHRVNPHAVQARSLARELARLCRAAPPGRARSPGPFDRQANDLRAWKPLLENLEVRISLGWC